MSDYVTIITAKSPESKGKAPRIFCAPAWSHTFVQGETILAEGKLWEVIGCDTFDPKGKEVRILLDLQPEIKSIKGVYSELETDPILKSELYPEPGSDESSEVDA